MKRVYVNEDWCLGCHLCEYYCAFANSGADSMVHAFAEGAPTPRIRVEEGSGVNFAVSCRHCTNPLCVKGCITGALSMKDGVVTIDETRCVGCFTCVLTCPYGAIVSHGEHIAKKCEHCYTAGQIPACVQGCPNRAIVYEERGAVR